MEIVIHRKCGAEGNLEGLVGALRVNFCVLHMKRQKLWDAKEGKVTTDHHQVHI